MVKGRQIKIYLAEGTVTGIRHAEIMGWTGQALAVPRKKVKELSDWLESHKPGVYFLFGADPESGSDAVYIGEAEQVANRIYQHLSGKDFWNEAICFTNKDENLTKAHVKYLESRIVSLANNANRFTVLNGNQPPQATLPRGDKDVMEEFIGNIRLLIGALGFRLLEPLVDNCVLSENVEELPRVDETLSLRANKYKAFAKQTDEGIVVLAGAEASVTANKSLAKGYRKIRESLIEKGKLTKNENKLILSVDVLFSSPSQAAAILLGYPCNGREYWLDLNGTSLKQKEEEQAQK